MVGVTGILAFFGIGLAWHSVVAWSLYGYFKGRSEHWGLTWPAQITGVLVLAVFAACIGDNDPFLILAIIGVVIFPPIGLLLLTVPFISFFVVPCALLVSVPLFFWRKARPVLPTLTFLITGCLIPFTADIYWDSAMCRSAQDHGLTDIQRPSFRHNLARVGDKSGREPYAIALQNGEIWDWSYSAERFVRYRGGIPAWADMDGFKPLNC